MINNRYCTFSSSSIWKLITTNRKGDGFGAPGLKYIKQVQYELNLGRAINKETSAKPTSWGTFLEKRVFDMLPLEYQLVSRDRIFHSTIPFYSGMPDVINGTITGDVKCPYSLETFCDKMEALKSLETYKEEFPEDYWQNISSAVLLESQGLKITHFEAIIYVPYKSELAEIRESAGMFDGDQNKVSFLNWVDDSELPYLIDDGYYKNLNIVRFPIPLEDKTLLISKVIEAGNKLIGEPSVFVAKYDEAKAIIVEDTNPLSNLTKIK